MACKRQVQIWQVPEVCQDLPVAGGSANALWESAILGEGETFWYSFNIRIDTPNIQGIEFKFSEAPDKTKSMAVAIESLRLDKLLIVYPGQESWPVNETISVCPIDKVKEFLM